MPYTSTMKLFVLTVITLLLVTSFVKASDNADLVAKVKKAIGKCSVETGITNETRAKLRNKIFTDIPKAKEYLYCIFRVLNWVDKEGNINKAIVTFVEQHTDRMASATKCLNVVGADPQDTVFQSYKCYLENLPEGVSSYDKGDNKIAKELIEKE